MRGISFIALAALAACAGLAVAADLTPAIPAMQGVAAESGVRYDAQSKTYTYLYTARNGAASKGDIGSLFLEHTKASAVTVPAGWVNAQRSDGSLMVSYSGLDEPKGSILKPGGSMQFSFIHPQQPVIATLRLRTDWIPEADDEDDAAARAFYARLETKAAVLAPGIETVGSFEHWSRLRDDVALAVSLGWVPDQSFAAAVTAQLAAARRAFDTRGATQAVGPLQALLATLDASTPAQRNASAFALLRLNTQALLGAMASAPATAAAPGPSPRLQLDTPDTMAVTAHLGETVDFTGRLTDRADDDKPMAMHPISLFALRGQTHTWVRGMTDADGRFRLALASKAEGQDIVIVGDKPASATVTVTWKGGPDLTVSFFIPPMIHWRGFGPMYMHDTVSNTGQGPSGAATVRYYLSATQPVDPKTARMVGSRAVGPLGPGENDENQQLLIQLPADLLPGNYFMTACVDPGPDGVETDTSNDCWAENPSNMHIMMAAPAATTRQP